MKVKIYEDSRGEWSFIESSDAREVIAEVADGYRVTLGAGDFVCVVGPDGESAIPVEEAIRQGVLEIPLLK